MPWNGFKALIHLPHRHPSPPSLAGFAVCLN
jgi:hypothetical protein